MASNPIDSPNPAVHSPAERAELSEREREILELVATGASNKEIAQQLVISPNTVKVHLRNIFGKIGVASRTEATLYAIREGLVRLPAGEQGKTEGSLNDAVRAEAEGDSSLPAPPVPARAPIGRHPATWVAGFLAVAVLILASVMVFWQSAPAAAPPTSAPPTPLPRWSTRGPMPTPRTGLAVAVYSNELYAIGGETDTEVTGVVERYDAEANTWVTLAAKPVPVVDAQAAVIGGLVYVPGGRTAGGEITDVLEAYDPHRDVWEQRTPMPVALSGYALAVFEGKLYLFGGWNGSEYVASTYEYNPDMDEWTERTRMPTARGFAGAAVAGDAILIIGGTNGEQTLTANEAYEPAQDSGTGEPWTRLAPLTVGRSHLGAASVAGIVHVVGGYTHGQPAPPLVYDWQTDTWQPFAAPPVDLPSRAGVAVLGNSIEVLGGTVAEEPSQQHLQYQAIYVISLPVLSP